MPAISFNNVDLPEPVLPIMATISPGATENVAPKVAGSQLGP